LGRALEIANDHRVLVRSRFNLSHRIEGDLVKILVRHATTLPFPVNAKFAYEMLIASLQRQISDLLHQEFTFCHIELEYAKPMNHKDYRDYCACDVVFDAQESALWIPVEVLIRPLMLSNQVVEQQAIAICEEEMKRLAQVQMGDIAWLVKAELARSNGNNVSLEALSARLGMNSRTLRRKLHLACTSYRELHQQYQLQAVARALADSQLSLASIAKQCGFPDSAGLRQAFARWTGMSPSQYRQQLK